MRLVACRIGLRGGPPPPDPMLNVGPAGAPAFASPCAPKLNIPPPFPATWFDNPPPLFCPNAKLFEAVG